MKKNYAFGGIILAGCLCCSAFGATVLKPKKAAPVAKQEVSTSTTNVGASMLPTALSLVQGVMELSQQQKALTAECQPSSSEINFVNNLVKEWANAGGVNPVGTKIQKCEGTKYETRVRELANRDDKTTQKICWDVFTDEEARGAVWRGYPKAVRVDYYKDGESKSKNKQVASNMWDIFALIEGDFSEADYTKSESSQAIALHQKVDRCSDVKLAAQKRAAVGGFITSTISNLGQPTNTASVMDAVTGIMGQKGVGGIGSLATVATQLLDK
jgi:hypothetical protein